jgi:hypothetical protein
MLHFFKILKQIYNTNSAQPVALCHFKLLSALLYTHSSSQSSTNSQSIKFPVICTHKHVMQRSTIWWMLMAVSALAQLGAGSSCHNRLSTAADGVSATLFTDALPTNEVELRYFMAPYKKQRVCDQFGGGGVSYFKSFYQLLNVVSFKEIL